MVKRWFLLLAWMVTPGTAFAQTQAPAPSYEVATVKPSQPEERGRSVGWEGRRFTARFTTLSQMMQFAYRVQEKQIVGEPGWFDTETFDIEVLAGASQPTVPEWRSILQKFLAERFRLIYHDEQRVMPAYVLVVARGGAKLQPAKGEAGIVPQVRMQRGPHQFLKVMGVQGNMTELAAELQRVETDRPVVDQTGLKGEFDFTMTATSIKPFFAGEAPDTSDTAPPGLFTAMQEQLGLKLEPVKTGVTCMVLDRVERPTAN